MTNEMGNDCAYRVMEVVMLKKNRKGQENATTHVMLVDNNRETLKIVQESMDEIVSNLVKVNKMSKPSKKVDESAQLFQEGLNPLFSVMAETSNGHILDKLSVSLKKALILMAMDRYRSNRDSVCRALGISPDKLSLEMELCGISYDRHVA
jgi:DNA-binding NtrC family response regulator